MPILCFEEKEHSHKELIARVRMYCRSDDAGQIAHCFLCNGRVKCSRPYDLTNVLHHMRSNHIEIISPKNWTNEERERYESTWDKHVEDAK